MPANSKTIPQINIMSDATPKSQRREPRDTGFPEPFNNVRNSTLPHPDADLSPNACISQEDVDPNLALNRTRKSFLRKGKRHTINRGKIEPQTQALYSVLSIVTTEHSDSNSVKHFSPTLSSGRLSKDETDSVVSRRDEETPPTSPDVPSYRSKKGLLRRLRRN